MTSVLTGFPNLDSLIGGLQQADMLLLTSPPSTENISLALSIVLNATTISQHRVGLFTLAMNKHQVVQRLLALSTGIDLHRVRTGSMTVDECNRLAITARTLSHAKIWIDDSVDLSVLQLQQRAQAMVKAHDIAFLLIDNIHCLRLGSTSHQHTHQIPEMGETSETLKMLAKALNMPVLVLAPHAALKANSYVATAYQGDHSRKKDADHVLFLYRENVSQPDIQDKSNFMTSLRIVNHQNGFVTDIALSSQSRQTVFPDEAHVSLPTSHDDVAS